MGHRVNTTETYTSTICTKDPSRCSGSPDHPFKKQSSKVLFVRHINISLWILKCKLVWFWVVETIPDINSNYLQNSSP